MFEWAKWGLSLNSQLSGPSRRLYTLYIACNHRREEVALLVWPRRAPTCSIRARGKFTYELREPRQGRRAADVHFLSKSQISNLKWPSLPLTLDHWRSARSTSFFEISNLQFRIPLPRHPRSSLNIKANGLKPTSAAGRWTEANSRPRRALREGAGQPQIRLLLSFAMRNHRL